MSGTVNSDHRVGHQCFSDTSSVIRNEKNQIIGRTSEKFHTTRDNHGSLVSTNSPDPVS